MWGYWKNWTGLHVGHMVRINIGGGGPQHQWDIISFPWAYSHHIQANIKNDHWWQHNTENQTFSTSVVTHSRTIWRIHYAKKLVSFNCILKKRGGYIHNYCCGQCSRIHEKHKIHSLLAKTMVLEFLVQRE